MLTLLILCRKGDRHILLRGARTTIVAELSRKCIAVLEGDSPILLRRLRKMGQSPRGRIDV
jgi:hypothetical protein